MLQAEKKPSHNGGKAITKSLTYNPILAHNKGSHNGSIVAFPGGRTLSTIPPVEYDTECLNIFGGKEYLTLEEWFEHNFPEELKSQDEAYRHKCPICKKARLDISAIQTPRTKPNFDLYVQCIDGCDRLEINQILGIEDGMLVSTGKMPEYTSQTRYKDEKTTGYDKKENPGYNKQEKKNYDGELDLVCMADVEAEEWNWLWYPYFPYGAMSLIDGDPAAGKTFLAIDIMAKVSNGDSFFLETGVADREPGNIIYCTSENSRSKSIKNRLVGAGADQSRIHHFEGIKHKEGYTVPFDFSEEGIKPLYRAMDKVKPTLLIIDPIQAYIGCDMNKAEQTRPNLQRLVGLAEKYSCAVIIIRHTTKGRQQKGAFRGMGSQDILGTARGGVYIGEDKETGDKVLTHAKHNESVKGDSLTYAIEENPGNGKPRVKWTGVSEKTADDLNDQDGSDKAGEGKSAIDEAIDFVIKMFEKESKILSSELTKHAKKMGVSDSSLKRAKKKIKEESEFDFYIDSEFTGDKWYNDKVYK